MVGTGTYHLPTGTHLAFSLVLVDPLGHEACLGLEHILAILPVPHKDPAIMPTIDALRHSRI